VPVNYILTWQVFLFLFILYLRNVITGLPVNSNINEIFGGGGGGVCGGGGDGGCGNSSKRIF
jgi:hypothetical protein